MTILDIHRRLVLLYEKVLRYGSVSFLEVNEIRDLENELAEKSVALDLIENIFNKRIENERINIENS